MKSRDAIYALKQTETSDLHRTQFNLIDYTAYVCLFVDTFQLSVLDPNFEHLFFILLA